jgi:hypothetical protein
MKEPAMRRVIPAALVMTLAGCGLWPVTPPEGGQLVVQNPLYGRFQTKVIPESARKLVILVTTRSDEQSKPVALVTLDPSEKQTIIRDIPVGRADVVVAAFNEGFDPVAANASDVAIIPSLTGQRTRLEIELSTDEGILRKLATALLRMKNAPSPSPSASAAPVASPSTGASVAPSGRPSGRPSVAAPSPEASSLFGPPPLANLQETFSGALDPTRWIHRNSGNPLPSYTVDNGLIVTMPADAVPDGLPNATAGVITARMTFFDVEATTKVTVLSGRLEPGVQVGLFTEGAGVFRTVVNGNPVYVLARQGIGVSARQEIPAPPAGGMDEFRLVRQGLTFRGFAGPAGDMKPVGTVPTIFGAIPMHIGIRADKGPSSGLVAKFHEAAVTLLTAPAAAPSPTP